MCGGFLVSQVVLASLGELEVPEEELKPVWHQFTEVMRTLWAGIGFAGALVAGTYFNQRAHHFKHSEGSTGTPPPCSRA